MNYFDNNTLKLSSKKKQSIKELTCELNNILDYNIQINGKDSD